MEVLNDVLAQVRSSRIGRGERQKRKDAWEAAAPCEQHPGILNSCHAEELSASALKIGQALDANNLLDHTVG